MDDGPVNKANAFANAAEDFAERGQFANAMEAHFRAAEQFLSAVGYTSDPEATKTLKLLYANHTRQGKELQRRLQTRSPSSSPRLAPHQHPAPFPRPASIQPTSQSTQPPPKWPGSNRQQPTQSPSLQRPQIGTQELGSRAYPSTLSGETSDMGSRHYFVGQSQSDSGLAGHSFRGTGHAPAYGGGGSVLTHVHQGPATMAVTSLDESERYLAASSAMGSVAQSYSVVVKGQEDDPEDPFNKFWEAVENLVEKISITGPVAFATAPIGNTSPVQDMNASGHLDLAKSERFAAHFLGGMTKPALGSDHPHSSLNASLRSTQMLNSYLVVPPSDAQSLSASRSSVNLTSTTTLYGRPVFYNGGVVVSEGENQGVVSSIESNYFGNTTGMMLGGDGGNNGSARRLASTSSNSLMAAGSSVGMAREYGGMRGFDKGQHPSNLQNTKTQEELLLENHHLKQTLNAVTHKISLLERAAEENNLLKSSIMQFRQDVQRQATRGKRGMGVSMISGRENGRERERELEARVRALEEELRKLREEGQRMNAAMSKYKERWDKLKESAKRKKEAASSSPAPPSENEKPAPSASPSPSLQHIYGSTPPSDVSHPPSPPSTTYGTSPADDGPRSLTGVRRGSSSSQSGTIVVNPSSGGGGMVVAYGKPNEAAALGSKSVSSYAGERSMFYSATSGFGFE